MDFLPHPFCHAFEEGRAAAENYVGKEVSADVVVALHDWVESVLVNSLQVVARIARLEEDLRTSESFVANENFAAVGKLIVLFAGVAFLRLLHGGVEVTHHIAHGFLDVTHNF